MSRQLGNDVDINVDTYIKKMLVECKLELRAEEDELNQRKTEVQNRRSYVEKLRNATHMLGIKPNLK